MKLTFYITTVLFAREKLPLKINDKDVALLLKWENSQEKSFAWSMQSLVRIGETV